VIDIGVSEYNDVKIRSRPKAESRVCINNKRDQERAADCRIDDKHRLWVDVSDSRGSRYFYTSHVQSCSKITRFRK